MDTTVDDILGYWFGDSLARGWPETPRTALWFGADASVDTQIQERFGEWVELALHGELDNWRAAPLSTLALVLLLDQFPRNIWRGSHKAFAGDVQAERAVAMGLAEGFDYELPWIGRVFMYMPLMHAEDLDLQDQCVTLFETLVREAPAGIGAQIQGNLAFAREHREIIARFGRFPHRNEALGRDSTPEELAYLKDAKRYGQ